MGKLAFIITDTKSHKTFDILESRKANYLKKYFYRFPRQQRLNVKFIIINLFGTYYDLFKSIFLMSLLFLIDFILLLKQIMLLNVLEFKLLRKIKRIIKNLNIIGNYFKNVN